MLTILVPLSESFNEETSEFAVGEDYDLDLEHSLVSLSKWEAKWELPFLGTQEKTEEQVLDYIRMMCLGPVPSDKVLAALTDSNINQINDYINAKMTATWFSESPNSRKSREVVTAEIVYHWMISLGIPFECQYWHLNRLITLVKVCGIKNQEQNKQEKISPAEVARNQRALNEQRLRELNTTG